MLDHVFMDAIGALRQAFDGALLERHAQEERLQVDILLGDVNWETSYSLPGEGVPPRVVAEVNLTGAPPEITEELFVTSLEALRCVVQWLGPPVDWLADVTVSSELLASFPNAEPTKGAT